MKIINNILITLGIQFIINMLWCYLEIFFYGELIPNKADTAIMILYSPFIYWAINKQD